MNLALLFLAFFLDVFLVGTCASAAETLRADHIQVGWLAPQVFGSAPETIAIDFHIAPEWHIYWRNPGDSGAAPKFNFQNSESIVGPIQWPFPIRLPLGDLVNLGYQTEVAFPFQLTPGKNRVHVEVKLEWLVCQEECTPGFGTLTLDRPVQSGNAVWSEPSHQALLKFLTRVPVTADHVDPATFPYTLTGVERDAGQIELSVVATLPERLKGIDILPLDGEAVKPQSPRIVDTPTGVQFIFEKIRGAPPLQHTGFILDDGKRAWEFPSVKILASASAPTTGREAESDLSLALILLSALIGGVILNFMPCVLPVLSIKFLSLAKADESQRVKEALLYSAGVVTTFVLLGAVFLGLRAAGDSVGWGFQLQSPVVVLALIILFWLMGLNFLGFFEIGLSVMNAAGAKTRRSGSFATGVLSVFVAAPCTGPFMGTALGAATTLPSVAALGIFLCLGIGLAFPFLIFAARPSLLRFMPKPGVWMETLKQFFAFPLFATVIWLMWVLGIQTGADGWLLSALLLFGLTFAIWLGKSRGRMARTLAWLIALTALVAVARSLSRLSESANSPAERGTSAWIPYSDARLAKTRAAHQAAFVDFTAAWCISCQVNKRAVLETDRGKEFFKLHHVQLFKGDWTKQDPEITKALAAFGRNSVPVYAFYPAGGSAPKILPQILTFSIIEDLFNP